MRALSEVGAIRAELHRLNVPPGFGEPPRGLGTVRFRVTCHNSAEETLVRMKQLLSSVDSNGLERWPDLDEWRTILPEWFVDACAPEMTGDEKERWLEAWRRMEPEEKAIHEKTRKWTLSSWLYWLGPDQRTWFWWDADASDESELVIALQVEEWPFPWGAFQWMCRAAGATCVAPEE